MYPDFDAIDAQTPTAVALGVRLMQSHKFAYTDRQHVRYLLDYAQFPLHGVVVDMGCGIGEFARLAAEIRPDLKWELVNMSRAQLDLCPYGTQFNPILRDAHYTGFPDASIDAVTFQTSLVQMNKLRALQEAYRILKPGGVLLISEMIRTSGDNEWWKLKLHGEVPSQRELTNSMLHAGFRTFETHEPWGDDLEFRNLLGPVHAEQLDYVKPILIRAVK